FGEKLGRAGFEVAAGAVPVRLGQGGAVAAAAAQGEEEEGGEVEEEEEEEKKTARVGLISHIGGHKFAGNAIVYIPPGHLGPGGEEHPLAGCGIWYGRVEPRHVEGLVDETVVRGRVVEDMFRGGIDAKRRMLRI
ncbi:hypothetical protein E4U41_007644, partial [Claviceps citrina]